MINDFLLSKHIKSSVRFSLASFILALFLLQPLAVFACGMSMISSANGWTFGNDSAEQSFINFANGEEKLIISRNFTNGSNDTVWVIPVPASPNSIKIDVLSDIPKFSGYDVSNRANEKLSSIRDTLLSTQIYPIVPIILNSLSHQTFGVAGNSRGIPQSLGVPGSIGSQDVVVYQHLEKEGMVAEVLSATNSDALYKYLNEKGLKVEKNSISILQDYIGKNFSFIASWVSPSATGQSTKGLLMTFPTDKIFYPLKPESGTPGNGLPETITVVGHVTPNLFENIKNSTDVNYYYSTSGLSLKDFFSSDNGFGFTKIVINVKPSELTQDLYISQTAPIKILNAQLINLNTFTYGLVLLIILSFLSTYLAARFVLSSVQPHPNLLGLGIANCLTLVGAIIGSRIFLKEKRMKFVISFSIIFVILTLVVLFLLSALYQ